MTTQINYLDEVVNKNYEHGFITDIENEAIPAGLSEQTVIAISQKRMSQNFY